MGPGPRTGLLFLGDFNPPIPCGMGQRLKDTQSRKPTFQSTHPVWDGTRCERMTGAERRISIHPSRVGWDRSALPCRRCAMHFNPPIPCGMGLSGFRQKTYPSSFQSTHPVWDGTKGAVQLDADQLISIHPSRVGWDCSHYFPRVPGARFQSTHPVWDGTSLFPQNPQRTTISIHPSRVGWDSLDSYQKHIHLYFNPPIPCGMGRVLANQHFNDDQFQSTHPVWDGTGLIDGTGVTAGFQSTHPVWDGTAKNI